MIDEPAAGWVEPGHHRGDRVVRGAHVEAAHDGGDGDGVDLAVAIGGELKRSLRRD